MELLSIYELPLHSAFLIFMLFGFVGWCVEVIYIWIFVDHKFVNRGFLYGPMCPIYGLGGAAILVLPKQLYSTWIPLFFTSAVLSSAVEYAASWILEKLFHARWWDYSNFRIHLKGRICLVNSVLFGVMGVVGIHLVYPRVLALIVSANDSLIFCISVILAVILAFDLIISVRDLILKRRIIP